MSGDEYVDAIWHEREKRSYQTPDNPITAVGRVWSRSVSAAMGITDRQFELIGKCPSCNYLGMHYLGSRAGGWIFRTCVSCERQWPEKEV